MSRGNGSNHNQRKDGPEYTGRTLVLLAEGDAQRGLDELENKAGIRVSRLASIAAPADVQGAAEGSVSFDEIGVAVIESDPEQSARVASAVADRTSPILAMEPERVVYAISLQSELALPTRLSGLRASGTSGGLLIPGEEAVPTLAGQPAEFREFLRGYRAAICHLDDLLSGAITEAPAAEFNEALAAGVTWGLTATKVPASQYSGSGIRLAVLDTGFDLQHPDFADRAITSASFVLDEGVQDKNGHGTHCIGMAAGPRLPPGGVSRYGVAYNAEIYAGKVLSNAGSGSDSGILAGINWAVTNRCAIVSMSLGARTSPGQSYSQVFEAAASRAAAKGTIIIAAAGNESERPGHIAPVSHPANCPSIIAVGALDEGLRVAPFSCGGTSAAGGEVNIAAPGVNVLSAWPLPARYRSIGGTSMATPHVAGIAALYAEATRLRGFALANAVLRRARRLTPIRDFGWGLVQSA